MGGTNPGNQYNTYSLTVSPSGQIFYLNAGDPHSTVYCESVDDTFQVSAPALANFSLLADAEDAATAKNEDSGGTPIPSPSGVSPTSAPFNGQFLQLDVVSIDGEPLTTGHLRSATDNTFFPARGPTDNRRRSLEKSPSGARAIGHERVADRASRVTYSPPLFVMWVWKTQGA